MFWKSTDSVRRILLRNKTAWMLAAAILGLTMAQAIAAQQSGRESSPEIDPDGKAWITVFGAVQNPSRFELIKPKRLLDALVFAGGLADRAGQTVQVIHTALKCLAPSQLVRACPVAMEVYSIASLKGGDGSSNPYLQPGDFVIVAESPPIYIVGSVVAPQAVILKEPTTLSMAIAMVGGLTRDARMDRIRILRSVPGETRSTVINVDLKKIWRHQSEDLVLQPYDIVDVPDRSDRHQQTRYPFGDIQSKHPIPIMF